MGVMVKFFSRMMPVVALSITEAELYAAVLIAQDMMFCYYIIVGLGLTVELPMILYIDNQGAVDLANNWSVGGRTRHMGEKQNYLRELKDRGFIQVHYRKGKDNTMDIGTKNLHGPAFKRFAKEMVSKGEL